MMDTEILVLEHDALQRDLIVLALKRHGFVPVILPQSADVAAHLLKHKPALLIMDIYQVEQSGLDLLEKLQRAGLLVLTRVIMLSSMGFPEVVARARRAGASDFLVKPIDSDLLVERVRRALGERLDG